MYESINWQQLKYKIKQYSDKNSELKLHMTGKNQREMKTDQSILNLKKKKGIYFNDFQKHRGKK